MPVANQPKTALLPGMSTIEGLLREMFGDEQTEAFDRLLYRLLGYADGYMTGAQLVDVLRREINQYVNESLETLPEGFRQLDAIRVVGVSETRLEHCVELLVKDTAVRHDARRRIYLLGE